MNILKIDGGLAEGQVLQRLGRAGASLQLEGACGETGTVHATLFKGSRVVAGWKKNAAGQASGGRFRASLNKIPAGGPYRLVLEAGKAKAVVKSFYVGDVWLLAGQSNMEGVGDMTHPARPHPLIRSFSMAREWRRAEDPLHLLRESPDICHHNGSPYTAGEARQQRRVAQKGVGVGLFFAREMLRRSGAPQGLVCTAHGGTSMMQWSPDLKGEGGASLYGSMLLSARATGQPFAGLLWYQGESDANDTDVVPYTDRMKKLVAATRRDLRQPALPWVIVQIGRFFDYDTRAAAWNDLQNQQRLLPDKIRNLETVASVDLSLDDLIHISAEAFGRLGSRLASAADRLVYGNRGEARPPQLREARLNRVTKNLAGASIDVVFDHVTGGLQARGEPCGFRLVAGDGQVWPFIYKTTFHGPVARLHLVRPPTDDIRLHYGHGVAPICNITDARDHSLPVLGPERIIRQEALLPFMTDWRLTGVIETPSVPLTEMECPDLAAFETTVKTYAWDGFVNEHPQWMSRSGHGYFSAQLELPEPMKLEFLLGYDGPIRLWLDGRAAFADLAGTNPCLPDKGSVVLPLKAGNHRVTVAMDLNGGAAWGFRLRFKRLDVTRARIRADSFRRPVYSV